MVRRKPPEAPRHHVDHQDERREDGQRLGNTYNPFWKVQGGQCRRGVGENHESVNEDIVNYHIIAVDAGSDRSAAAKECGQETSHHTAFYDQKDYRKNYRKNNWKNQTLKLPENP